MVDFLLSRVIRPDEICNYTDPSIKKLMVLWSGGEVKTAGWNENGIM